MGKRPLSGLPAWTFIPSVVTSELLHCALCWADAGPGQTQLGWMCSAGLGATGRKHPEWALRVGCGSGGGGAGWGGEAYSKRSRAADRLQARQGRWGLRADRACCADPWRRAVQGEGQDRMPAHSNLCSRLRSPWAETQGEKPRSARKPDLGLSSGLWDASQTSCFLKNGIPTTSVAPRRQQESPRRLEEALLWPSLVIRSFNCNHFYN